MISGAIFALVFVFALLSVALLPLNYAAFSVFLTPSFVLLAEASTGDWHLAGVRILNTVLGGGLALAGSQLLWPSPESERLPAYLAQTITALRKYLALVIQRFDDRSEDASRALREARRQVGLAILNAEESFQRLLGEHRGPAEALAPAMTLLTYTRRFTASIAALALSRHSVDAVQAEALAPFAQAADAALADVAAALAAGRAPAPLGRASGAAVGGGLATPSGTADPARPPAQDAARRRGAPVRHPERSGGPCQADSEPRVSRSLAPLGKTGWLATDGVLGSRYISSYLNPPQTCPGQVSEWLKEPVSKTGIPARVSRVRIPPCPSKQVYAVRSCSACRPSCRSPATR